MKHILKILFLLLIISITIILILSNINKNNNKYLDNITKNIKENYNIKEKITYSNLYGNYYIFTTKTKVIVLNKEYEEINKFDIEILSNNKNNYPLIYKNNKLMYEETIKKKNKIIYKYYDATNNKLIKEISVKEDIK